MTRTGKLALSMTTGRAVLAMLRASSRVCHYLS